MKMKKYKNAKYRRKMAMPEKPVIHIDPAPRVVAPKIHEITAIPQIADNREIYKYDIYYVNLGDGIGHEQSKTRPCVVCQNNIGNRFSPTTIVCPLSSVDKAKGLPTRANLGKVGGLKLESFILAEQIRTIDKSRLQEKVGSVCGTELREKIDMVLRTSLGL